MNKNENFHKAFKACLDGMSLRNIEKNYGISRDSFINMCNKEFPEGSMAREKLKAILKEHKKNSEIIIEESKLIEICHNIFKGEKTLKECAKEYEVDEQTLNEKIQEVINKNEELRKEYLEHEEKIHPDYSYINFRSLIIEMIETNKSQTEIAKKYNIKPRRISREIEKLKDEDKELYEIAKEYSYRKMKKEPFNQFETKAIGLILANCDKGEPVIKINILTKEEKKEIEYEKNKKIIQQIEMMDGTIKEKCEKLGIGVSTLRRTKNRVKNYEMMHRKETKAGEEGER